MKGFFITGTDTGVGKTLVSTGILAALGQYGWRGVGFKPVAAGIEPGSETNEDVLSLAAVSRPAVALNRLGPFQFRAACAPHIAAALEGQTLPRHGWKKRASDLLRDAEVLIVEGAGGFCVPLSPPHEARWGLDDLAQEIGLPVVLVVGLRLGCLNHALLTAQAVQARGIPLAAWVCNRIDPNMLHADENIASLRAWLPAPCWGDIPWTPQLRPEHVAARLDTSAIFRALSNMPC
ncbi:MAG: dethiobiotin synthase [Burkholderiales bacterium]|jgi:dethiobiotin synthetase